MNIKDYFKTNSKIAYMTISSNYYANKYLFIPKAMTSNHGLQPLVNYKYINKKLTDIELGELVIETLKISKQYRKKDIIVDANTKTREKHEQYLKCFEMDNIRVDVTLDYEKNEYTIQKLYHVTKDEYDVEDYDPIHVLPGDVDPKILGETINIAFFDVGIRETKMLREKEYCYIEINRNVKNNKIFIRPYGFGHLGLLTSLYEYEIIDGSIDDYNLGKLAVEYLNKSKESIGKNISIKPNGYDKEFEEQNIDAFLKDSQHLNMVADYISKNYRVAKSYRLKRNGATRKKDDPEHILPIDAPYELIGKTIREAFDDVSAEGKTI